MLERYKAYRQKRRNEKAEHELRMALKKFTDVNTANQVMFRCLVSTVTEDEAEKISTGFGRLAWEKGRRRARAEHTERYHKGLLGDH